MKEYIIWGKETDQAQHETLLVSEHAGIKTMDKAKETVEILKSWGCVDVRIQVFDIEENQDIQNMFKKAITI